MENRYGVIYKEGTVTIEKKLPTQVLRDKFVEKLQAPTNQKKVKILRMIDPEVTELPRVPRVHEQNTRTNTTAQTQPKKEEKEMKQVITDAELKKVTSEVKTRNERTEKMKEKNKNVIEVDMTKVKPPTKPLTTQVKNEEKKIGAGDYGITYIDAKDNEKTRWFLKETYREKWTNDNEDKIKVVKLYNPDADEPTTMKKVDEKTATIKPRPTPTKLKYDEKEMAKLIGFAQAINEMDDKTIASVFTEDVTKAEALKNIIERMAKLV